MAIIFCSCYKTSSDGLTIFNDWFYHMGNEYKSIQLDELHPQYSTRLGQDDFVIFQVLECRMCHDTKMILGLYIHTLLRHICILIVVFASSWFTTSSHSQYELAVSYCNCCDVDGWLLRQMLLIQASRALHPKWQVPFLQQRIYKDGDETNNWFGTFISFLIHL